MVNTAKSYEIKFEDRLRSCEDAFLIEKEGLAILACDAGRERFNTVMVWTQVSLNNKIGATSLTADPGNVPARAGC